MIGFDFGGTKCAVSIGEEIDGKLHIKDKRVIPTDHQVSAYDMLDRMCNLAEEMTDDLELIAVITAAIAAGEGTSTDGFVVRSIRRRTSNNW